MPETSDGTSVAGTYLWPVFGHTILLEFEKYFSIYVDVFLDKKLQCLRVAGETMV